MRATLCILASSFLGCGPLIYAEAVVEEVCLDQQVLEMPAAPISQTTTFEKKTSWATADFSGLLIEGLDTKVELLSAELSADGQEIQDLSFVDQASLTTALAGEPFVLTAKPASAASPTLEFRPQSPLDVTALLEQEEIPIEASITGTLPEREWTLSVRACFRMTAEYGWTPEL